MGIAEGLLQQRVRLVPLHPLPTLPSLGLVAKGGKGAAAVLGQQVLGPVLPTMDGGLLEDHDVLGESARLVAEEDLYLAQLLVQVGGVALGRLVGLRVVQLQVPGEEQRAKKLLHLQRHIQAVQCRGARSSFHDTKV